MACSKRQEELCGFEDPAADTVPALHVAGVSWAPGCACAQIIRLGKSGYTMTMRSVMRTAHMLAKELLATGACLSSRFPESPPEATSAAASTATAAWPSSLAQPGPRDVSVLPRPSSLEAPCKHPSDMGCVHCMQAISSCRGSQSCR